MGFEVVEVLPATNEVKIRHGSLVMRCRVLVTNGRAFIQKPPYVYIDGDVWHYFIDLIREAWEGQRMMENGNNEQIK